ncbi:MAG: DUF1653 domain-containing protein, partial [Lachnospiraceae bacterium]|nr:DUF1653 domain-containing protein [Lachnospiraceae bacterium]
MREIPKPGEFYRHFKNKNYEIVTVASHSETGEKFVVYRALYDTFQDYIRPLEMFMSEVDHEKYPDVLQTYRFEKIGDRIQGLKIQDEEETTYGVADFMKPRRHAEAETVPVQTEKTEEPLYIEESDAEGTSQELLLSFLNAETYDDKLELLRVRKGEINHKLIDDIGTVMDMPIKEGGLEDRYLELTTCLRTMSRYDG